LSLITDVGVGRIAERTKFLNVFNVNKCPLVSQESLQLVLKKNPALTTFHVSYTRITDDGLTLLTSSMSSSAMTSVDISFCSEVADFGVVSLAESCINLRYLNMRGLSRVTDRGVKTVCNNCWYLTNLNLEDIFLASDDAFWFSVSGGKIAGNDLMYY